MANTYFPPDIQAKESYISHRASLLNEAMDIVHKDRASTYGDPEDNFQTIAAFWRVWLAARRQNSVALDLTLGADYVDVSPADVAVMNILQKIARLAKTPGHHDSAVDIAGYAACLGELQAKAHAKNSGVFGAAGLSPDCAAGCAGQHE